MPEVTEGARTRRTPSRTGSDCTVPRQKGAQTMQARGSHADCQRRILMSDELDTAGDHRVLGRGAY